MNDKRKFVVRAKALVSVRCTIEADEETDVEAIVTGVDTSVKPHWTTGSTHINIEPLDIVDVEIGERYNSDNFDDSDYCAHCGALLDECECSDE